MKHGWKSLTVLMLALMVVVSGCSGGAKESAGEQGAVKNDGPMTMRWWVRGTAGEIPDKNMDLLKKKVKDRFNVNLEIEILDRNVNEEKLNVAWAGGSIPDIVEMQDTKMVYQAVTNNALLPLDDMVKNDPNFSKLPAEFFGSSRYNGKIYSVPTWLPVPETLYYRVDWAKKLGVKQPTNADELYTMLKAFAKNDPDGNGKDDTFGLTLESTLDRTSPIWQLFVPVPPMDLAVYVDKSDSVQSSFLLTEDMKSALSWLRKAYSEGVLDKEWVLEKASTAEDKFVTGKVGTWIKGAQWIVPRYEKMRTKFPNADITSLPLINGKYGANYASKANYTSVQFLTYACKQPDRCKQVFAYLWGPEGIKDRRLGADGSSYKIENNKLVFLDPAMEKVYNPGSLLTSVFKVPLPVPDPVLELSLKNGEGYRTYLDLDPFIKQSDKAIAKSADISKMSKEYIAKIVIGEYSLDKYDEFVSKLKSMGIDDVLKEVNDIYKKNK